MNNFNFDTFLDIFRSDKAKKYKKKPDRKLKDDELLKFRQRIQDYRDSFAPYNRSAPGFDYITWKPYGYWRDEDHNHSYVTQCYALAPWVRATASAGCVGLEERRWDGLVGQPEEALKSQYASAHASRSASRENLLGS